MFRQIQEIKNVESISFSDAIVYRQKTNALYTLSTEPTKVAETALAYRLYNDIIFLQTENTGRLTRVKLSSIPLHIDNV